MTSQTDENAFEALIEKALTGSNREERLAAEAEGRQINEDQPIYGPSLGYEAGHPGDYDREFAIDKEKFWRFLENTQAEEIAKLQSRPNWQRLLLERLDRKIKKDGLLKILKDGLAIDDAIFTLFYSPPVNDLNPLIAKRFAQNIFSVTRQVHFSEAEPAKSVDMVIFINGLPIITIELKNAWTGQQAWQARKQYMRRDKNIPLFNFARCVVHLAVDTDEAWMTTKLNGDDTFFLPFNKGFNFGKGNPPNQGGHRSSYLWEEVLTKESLANILEHFVVLVGEKKRDPLSKKTLYFPRYHQLDVTRRLLDDVREKGIGHTYLIQHSAGSGKSNSITWTAYQLIELYAKDENRPIFDSVIVVTDRTVLDKQLRDNISDFSEVKNIVAHAKSAADLKKSLEESKKIIITTIQKFPVIVDGIDDLSDRKFAVIIDEAHSSQSGISHDKLNITLGIDEEEQEEPLDPQDIVLRAMEGRKLGRNASYFAFTATPKNATLEKFGEETPDKKFVPFHLYSMKQAIEEGFILDVLANYTTYKSYYEIKKSILDNPLFETKRAQKKLRAFVEGDQETIAVKAEIITQHFLKQVVATKKLKGKAKGMVVTRNIKSAIRYYHAIRDELKQANSPIKAIVAFSGKKTVDGNEYTEDILNNFPSKDIEDKFDSDEYRLLIVANKYLYGFDQPKLSTMYVDKKLQGLFAVQALSRLNRSNLPLGKRTEDIFVLDFFNSISDIKQAFDPFYTSTSLSEATDVNVLHDLKDSLDDVGVYEWVEVERFIELYFAKAEADQLSPIIDICAVRFEQGLELDDEDKADFKIKAKQFVKIYAQVASILPYNVLIWEKLYWFLKFLIPKLRIKDRDQDALDELLNSVDLSTYGLERVKLNVNIGMDASEGELDPTNPNPRGAHGTDDEKDPLDEIIKAFNERWFSGWEATPEEQRIKFLNIAQHVADNSDYSVQVADNPDEQNRRLAMEKLISHAVGKERKRELDLYKRYASDPDFKRAFDRSVMRILEEGLGGIGDSVGVVE
jgi:type I restriction enzyme, R subunit